jgi:DNA-binding transcriptional LysR family regulator
LRRDPLGRLIDAVRNGEFDVAFVDSSATKQADLECHLFRSNEFAVYVTPGHPLAERDSIRLEELGSEPFIAIEQKSSMYIPFAQAAKANNVTRPFVEFVRERFDAGIEKDDRPVSEGINGFRHVGISVKNMDVSLAFYVQLLGLTMTSDRVSLDGGRFVGAGDTAVRICLLEIP